LIWAVAGFDCFLAAKKVCSPGKVIGIDITPEMIEKAKKNTEKQGIKNIEFRLCDMGIYILTLNPLILPSQTV
jgi:ubiquinone/menaquinone biosynthesis C-methylase UbiE